MTARSWLDADMPTLGRWLLRGWEWWLGELAALVPARLRRAAADRRPRLAWDAAAGTLAPASGGLRPALADAAVMLPAGLCLLREIETPLLPPRDLARMIALDADRLMPLPRAEMIVAARIVARADSRLRVAVAGLPRAAALPLVVALAAAGGAPAAVLAPVGGDGGAGTTIDLLPALRARGLVGGRGDGARRWWLAVAALFALNLALIAWRDSAATDSLATIVDTQQGAVAAARAIAGRIHRADAMAAAVIAARRGGEPLALMARVDAALPPGVWLQRFGWDGAALHIAGYRPAGADVPAALRRAGFAVIRYGDGGAAGASALGQPFDLTLRVAGR